MSFDAKKFRSARFSPRAEDVPVPDLKDYFDGSAPAVWRVQGLTGKQLARANEAAERNNKISALFESIVGGGAKEQAAAVAKALGIAGKETPQDIAKRIYLLVQGSVDPVCDEDLALKLCEAFPIEFYTLTNRITLLTGQGHVPGKAGGSGGAPTSEPA